MRRRTVEGTHIPPYATIATQTNDAWHPARACISARVRPSGLARPGVSTLPATAAGRRTPGCRPGAPTHRPGRRDL